MREYYIKEIVWMIGWKEIKCNIYKFELKKRLQQLIRF